MCVFVAVVGGGSGGMCMCVSQWNVWNARNSMEKKGVRTIS